jgi:two-component system sensor histidine kinase PhoQ
MSVDLSIRTRLVLGAALVLVAFMAAAGLAVQRAHTDSVLTAHYARLQGTIYLLLAGAEIEADGALVMPPGFAEPRLSLPGSGLYASILNINRKQEWRSGSVVGIDPPFERNVAVGEWKYEMEEGARGAFLSVAYGVRWAGAKDEVPLSLSVLENKSEFDRELKAFRRTLWSWLGGAGLLLLLSQTLLLRWGLSPLQRVAQEIARIEHGTQTEVQGHYPREIRAMTGNLNTLIKQERVRQTRYKEALSYLAHSLKTPLAVLRNALAQPAQLPAAVSQQVSRMDQIVQHQLTRAAASGSARFAPFLALAPVLHRIRDSLGKVYADKGLVFDFQCAPDLRWRIDEGDAFEMLGNLLDNAAKWAKQRVSVKVWRDSAGLRIRIEDDGPGFGDTESILQLHVRADEQVPGHGVGLAVVNDLVASHEGQLELSRGGLGGAQVEILLPAP